MPCSLPAQIRTTWSSSSTPQPGATNREFEAAIRLGAFRVSRRLAETTLDAAGPDQVEQFELGQASSDLPRVAYVDQVQQQGILVQTFLYGNPSSPLCPRFYIRTSISTAQSSAVTTGSMIKIPTWLRLNHPVIRALYHRHRKDLNFVGVIFCRGHFGDHERKERNGYMVANVARMLGVEGAVMTLEGTGNTWVDFMQSVRALERSGVRTVQIVHELGGVEGRTGRLLTLLLRPRLL